MNLLIIGGLFGIAVLALIGVALLVVGERNATRARTNAAVQPDPSAERAPQQQLAVPAAAPTAAPSQAATSTSAARSDMHATQKQTRVLTSSTSASATSASPEVFTLPQRSFPLMNGQLHEFSAQLRMLQQQSRELEQRLTTLVTVLEQAEHSSDRSLLSDEGVPTSPTPVR
jgi:hypothetical protein